METSGGISRYKPAILVIAAFSTAYALYLLRGQFVSIHEAPPPQSGSHLHRSNAVRHGFRRRRRTRSSASLNVTAIAEQAISNLRARDTYGRSYGTYTVTIETGSGENMRSHPGHEVELLPSHLGNLAHYRIPGLELDIPTERLQDIMMEAQTAFMIAFLSEEFDPAHLVGELDRMYLTTELDSMGIPSQIVSTVLTDFNAQRTSTTEALDLANQVDGIVDENALSTIIHRQETVAESDSYMSVDEGVDRESLNTSQNMMDLLYHIGEEQARRGYYIHRGIVCNSCGTCPIQGIRYHCVNCFDYDLCEACEAGQVHIKTHVFLKLRIPGPRRGNVKEVTPSWYPGKPEMLRDSLPQWVSRNMLKDRKLDKTELDILYEQFRTLAGAAHESDSLGIGMAIDRAGFDRYFVCSSKSRHAPPSLVFDRIFAFYDTNKDGLIDFEEFVRGMTELGDKSRGAKLQQIFKGYDLDDDGFVDRKDFLRMFRSYYAWNKELNREHVAQIEEDHVTDGVRELIESSQPISAAFTGTIPNGHTSRSGVGKELEANGDMSVLDGRGVLEEDSSAHGDRGNAISAAAMGQRGNLANSHPFRTFRQQPTTDEPVIIRGTPDSVEIVGITHVEDVSENELEERVRENPATQVYGWPPINNVEPSDIINALGREVPFEEIMDPIDRSRVVYAQSERLDAEWYRGQQQTRSQALRDRWRRRQFYLDHEEGMTAPPGYAEVDSSDDGSDPELEDSATDPALTSRRPSMRSRSSSKVRFEDSVTDTDYETRSNTSSRSIPVGERWGGFEISEVERDISKEILYQTVQQGYNELLDRLFKEREDQALAATRSRSEREKLSAEIESYKKELEQQAEENAEALRAADMLRTEELLAAGQSLPQESRSPGQSAQQSITRDEATGVSRTNRNDILRQQVIARTRQLVAGFPHRSAGPSLLATLNLDPETASISSQNARIESANGQPEFPNLGNEPFDEAPPDPTLPQNRPDSSSKTPVVTQPQKPSRSTLALYLTHEECDQESKMRGGPGKISFDEFAAMMVDDDKDEVLNALGHPKNEGDRQGKWPSRAGLGRLGFVGTWLDWASF